jgi:beta-mannanase
MNIKHQTSNFKTINKFQFLNNKWIGIYFFVFLICFEVGSWKLGFAAEAMAKAGGETVLDNHKVFTGIFREGAPANMNYINKYVEEVGKKPAMIMWYQDWAQTFPKQDALKVINYGAVPHIVWEPWYWSDHSKVKLTDIIDGNWDSYIRSWAKEAKAFNKPIFIRLAHEFNIEGYPWGVVNQDKDHTVYIKAYRHVVDIFRNEQVSNVKWVWCFMNYSFPDEAWNDWTRAYPGDNYVDWVGIDGYNWGTTQSWSNWQVLKYLFRDQARMARKLWPNKPIMVAEFASADKGGDKAAWIRDIPAYLKSSMRDIDAIVWFDLKKETDWRIKSSPAALQAYREIMTDPMFSSSGEALAQYKLSHQRLAKRQIGVMQASGSVTIDGDLKEWGKCMPLAMTDRSFVKEGLNWGGPKDLSGLVYLMWDNTNLYIAANIDDVIPLVNKQRQQNIWNGDAIEFVMSVDPSANPARTNFGSSDYQVGLGVGNGKDNQPIIWNWQRRRSPAGSEIAVKPKDGTGYIIEAKIPWEFFRPKFTPSAGIKLSFDIAFDDADKTGERERQMIWNGDFYFYKDPSVWGVLELK